MAAIVGLEDFRPSRDTIYFSRADLNRLLSLFSRRLLARQWLDYSIDNGEGMAVFCVYRRAHDAPLYKIFRLAPRAHPKGEYLVTKGDCKIRHAATLEAALQAFDPSLRAVQS